MKFGSDVAGRLKGGEILELSGDVGTGKTTFVKGLAQGLKIEEVVQSPTYTISQIYQTPAKLALHHYDFYRLDDPGIMRGELEEALEDKNNIVALEWDETVRDVLPEARTIRFKFTYSGEHSRKLEINAPETLSYMLEEQ